MIKKFLLGALLAAVSAPAMAQAPLPDADPAMWVVKDEDTTIYLFGTFHLLDGKKDWFNDEVKTAFDASDEVIFEAKMPDNPADIGPLAVKYAMDASGKTLTSKLSADTSEKLGKALADMGAPANAFDMFEPWFASMSLAAVQFQKLGMTPEHGTEMVLTAAAKQGGKEVGELEGFEYQFKLFDTMPEEQQIAYLGQTLDNLDEATKTIVPMQTAWAAGDVEGLASIMNKGLAETPELYELLLTKRNANWAEWIDARMDKPGTVFVAVGAGHLAGEGSVQDLLAKRGIKSERVTQ